MSKEHKYHMANKVLTEFELPKRKMANHLEFLFIFLLVLILSLDPVWLAPPPSTTTELIIPDSPLQDPSVRAKQESFLVHPMSYNTPKVGEYEMITDTLTKFNFCMMQISYFI